MGVASTGRAELLRRYRAGTDAVRLALAGATEAELEREPPDGWTARMVVHHLADSEATAYIRLRRLIAEDRPRIEGYDEAQFAARLHYERPIEPSLAVLEAVRSASLQLLESLGQEEWARAGVHSESGDYSVHDWLRIYVDHPREHADQIRRARLGQS